MDQPTTLSLEHQPLLSTYLSLLQPLQAACTQQRTVHLLSALGIATVVNHGRQTITQLLAALGHTGDWSAFYRLFSTPRLDPDQLVKTVATTVLEMIPEDGPCVVAIDGVQLPCSSWKLIGSCWLYNPTSPVFHRGIWRARRWVNLAVLLPENATGYSRAVPVRFDPAIPEKGHRPEGMDPQTEWAVGLEQMHWMRAILDEAGRHDQPLLVVADSGWQGAGVWGSLPARTTLVSGCRTNRALYAMPTRSTGRGRPRLSGERAPAPRAWLQTKAGMRRFRLTVRGRKITGHYQVHGPYLVQGAPEQPLYLLVVHGSSPGRGKRQRRARYWLVNAVRRDDGSWKLPHPVPTLLAWCWQRWEIEVTHRELKTGFGVGQGQQWNQHSAFMYVRWQVAVYSVLVMAAYQCWRLEPDPNRQASPWWRGSGRWSLDQVRQAFRREIGGLAEFRPVWTGTPHNWWKIQEWVQLLQQATLSAGRL